MDSIQQQWEKVLRQTSCDTNVGNRACQMRTLLKGKNITATYWPYFNIYAVRHAINIIKTKLNLRCKTSLISSEKCSRLRLKSFSFGEWKHITQWEERNRIFKLEQLPQYPYIQWEAALWLPTFGKSSLSSHNTWLLGHQQSCSTGFHQFFWSFL